MKSTTQPYQETYRLYLIHSCFSFMSQMWSMGISLFIASVSNNSLFIIAIAGLVSNLSIILFIPSVGNWVDRVNRLTAVNSALFIKVVAISLGFCICAFLPAYSSSSELNNYNFYFFVIVLPLVCAAANIGFNTYTLCIEKDWLVELSNGNSEWLAKTNSVMSQIDLTTQSVAPALTAGLFSLFSTAEVATILLLSNFTATFFLCYFLKSLYEAWPSLHTKNNREYTEITNTETNEEESYSFYKSIDIFLDSGCVGVMMSYSYLFLTVLSFDTIMTVYLIFMGMSEFYVGLARGVSAIIGFLGASIYPFAKEKFGLWLSGTLALVWQATFVGLAALSFTFSSKNLAIAVLTISVLISRVGLWLFDLCARQIAQETIKENVRGSVNGTWQSIINTFELSAYAITMIFPQPNYFWVLSFISFTMVFTAAITFGFAAFNRPNDSTEYELIISSNNNENENAKADSDI